MKTILRRTYDLLVNRATRYEAETTETIAELRIPGGMIYTLPSGRKVLITDADFQRIAMQVSWDIGWQVAVIILAVLVALALSGCRLGTPDFKPSMTARAAPSPTNSVALAWDSAGGTGPLTYSVHRGVASRVYTNVVKGIVPKTYLSTNLTPGVRYYFAVTAVDSLGIPSPFSNEASYSLATNTPPPTPKFIDRVVFSWRNNNGSQPYRPVLTNDFLVTNKLGQYRVESVQRLVR